MYSLICLFDYCVDVVETLGWSAIDNFDLCSEKHKRQEHQAPTTMLYRNAQETESRNAKYPKVKQAEYPKENTERTGIFI